MATILNVDQALFTTNEEDGMTFRFRWVYNPEEEIKVEFIRNGDKWTKTVTRDGIHDETDKTWPEVDAWIKQQYQDLDDGYFDQFLTHTL